MRHNILGLVSCNYTNEAFGNLTAARPVASIPFGGRYRLLDFILSNMVNVGMRTIGIITPYYYRSILDHVGAGKEWSLNRKSGGMFILPGSIYGLKNARGMFLLRDIIGNRSYLDRSTADHVLLSGSNKIFNMDLLPFFEAHRASGGGITLLYKHINDATAKEGLFLQQDGGAVTAIRQEAVGAADLFMDCLLIDRKLLLNFIDWYQTIGYIDIMDIITENLDSLQVGAYGFDGYLGSIDSVSDYMNCSMDLLRDDVRRELFYGEGKIYTKVQDTAPAKYAEGSRVLNSLVPTGCIIEGTVENSILFRGVTVGKGAVIKNSVIMQKCEIGPGVVLENVICDKLVKISSEHKLFGRAGKPLVLAKQSEI